jgi:glycosyltransferase involved in cell wall biosynthesis
MSRLTVTLFMPTLNELEGVRYVMPRINRAWCDQILVVDGGSTDGTIEELKKWDIDAIPQEGRGLAGAWNTGFKHSQSDVFILLTPDGNCIPELIPDLVAKIAEGNDLVLASRYLPPAKSEDDSALTAFGNWMFTTIIRVLFKSKVTDSLGGYRAYRRTAVLAMNLHRQHEESWIRGRYPLLNTWEIGSAIRSAKVNLRVAEIPGDEPARVGGISKMSIIRNGTAAVFQILLEVFSRDTALNPQAIHKVDA